MTTASSASDRYAEARAWLAQFDQADAEGRVCWHDMPEGFEDFLPALRAIIEPPATEETAESIADEASA